MQIPLQITIRDLPHSDELDALIRRKVAALERVHSRITSCRVAVAGSGKHRLQGRGYDVRIEVRVPGNGNVVVNQLAGEDVLAGLRDAFDAVARQLDERVGKRQDAEKSGRRG
jgi:ribosomal subunit interface protein